jgi:hypothetical protein
MFCDGCGGALHPGQYFCSLCGKEIKGGMHVAYPRPSRVQSHIRLLGILWLAFAAFSALGGAVLYIVANTLFVRPGTPANSAWLHPFLSFIAVAILIKAAASAAAGWGLLQREPWARILTLILSFLSLFHVPFGTVLGIYSLWVLLPTQSDQEYEAQVRAA